VNFPSASNCRKCGTAFEHAHSGSNIEQNLKFHPKYYNKSEAFDILNNSILSKDKKIISISGVKGVGKSELLHKVIKNLKNKKYYFAIGKCSSYTQLTPGGVIQDILLNLFGLPKYCDVSLICKELTKSFSKEFKFLNDSEIEDFINFLYNSKIGNYENIINNKKYTYGILAKVFSSFIETGKCVLVIDNFDFIDGFSIEFFTNFIHEDFIWKNIKLIVLYNEFRPVINFLGDGVDEAKSYVDINLCASSENELKTCFPHISGCAPTVTEHEHEVIIKKSKGNPAFMEQALSYCSDCKIADKAFILKDNFSELIKNRLEVLKKTDFDAYKVLCMAAILEGRLYPFLISEIFGFTQESIENLISILVKFNYIYKYNEIFYEIKSHLLWDNIYTLVKNDREFNGVTIQIVKLLSKFDGNATAVLAAAAYNLKEYRMAFDIWAKVIRIAAYIGDINLYVICQKQSLAVLNEFNEAETLNIRYNISEKLGKILTEYDPDEAIEYLPDAISNAKTNNKEEKEIELLGYLAACCKKIGNYYGDIECSDNILKKLPPSGYELEAALIKATKLYSLIKIGNCGEVVNLVDNDILPVLNSYIDRPALDKSIPLDYIARTRLKVYYYLAKGLILQGNDRSFEILSLLKKQIEKLQNSDNVFLKKVILAYAQAYTMKGDYQKSYEILKQVFEGQDFDYDTSTEILNDIKNEYLDIICINKLMLKDYENIQQYLYDAVFFAEESGNKYAKHFLKILLGKVLHDNKQAKKALDIYNEEILYFAKEKTAIGAILSWYLISEASITIENSENAIDTAQRALEIAQNPAICNYFLIVLLNLILARCNMEISDFENAKIYLEKGLAVAKKYNMNDLLSRIYLLYGDYYRLLGLVTSQSQKEYLKGSQVMYGRASELITQNGNIYLKKQIDDSLNKLNSYCSLNGIGL